ncbi:MAG: protein kinase [Isosphaeraceae bacterium]|nr:protein kinase [Isosphaeraceae bacterium]
MAMTSRGRIWDEASSPAASRLARAFEADWRSRPHDPPDPRHYLPNEPGRGPGAILALLRADLALRRGAGEPVRVEWYAERYAQLEDEVLVALLYEEFCLREEAGESPRPAEYEVRFPGLAPQLGEILEIHEWVGSTESWSLAAAVPSAPFPETGQTIDGFRLVEELGRGAFARVYLAEEQGLADRPVALKVARRGSAEPQTLARLQHTHIVPVYSYRTDPSTGLHLLCMPYFGRVTLAAILADERCASARSGAELLAVFDALRPASEVPSPRAEGRAALARRSLGQAVAWWGARLAEALHHAHEQGILHSDVKPSNVLVTADAVPMLLDFNLSHAAPAGGPDVAPLVLGGTLAYMAPEHLRAVAEQATGVVDARADVYGLGVVLFEVLASRPFPTAVEGRPGEALRTLIDQRRAGPPWERLRDRNVPAALEAVIRKCLAADPPDRYQTAAQLAVDLHAVADDGPLRFAREPEPARTLRWGARNRLRITVVVALLALSAAAMATAFRVQARGFRREGDVRQALAAGRSAEHVGQLADGSTEYARAAALAKGYSALRSLHTEAEARQRDVDETQNARARADGLFRLIEPLRFRLITGKELKSIGPELQRTLEPFHVLSRSDWNRLPDFERLDPPRRARLLDEVNELLFLWVWASDPHDAEGRASALALCDRALLFAEPKGPWRRLRTRYEPEAGPPGVDRSDEDPEPDARARGDFQRGLVALLDGPRARGLAWLERAVSLRPNDFWHQFALAFYCERYGEADRALAHYSEAIALRPDSAWAHFNRALLYASRKRAWGRALDDLAQARRHPDGLDPLAIRLEAGQIALELGDFPTALAELSAVVASADDPKSARIARLSRARALAGLGAVESARADYDAVLRDDPTMTSAALGRALLALRVGRVAEGEAELTRLLDGFRGRDVRPAELLNARAQARLLLGDPARAQADAAELLQQGATPARLRLWTRVALALRRDTDLGQLQPDDMDRLPVAGPALRRDLRAAANRLRSRSGGETPLPALLTRAVVLSALGAHGEALADADRAVALRPDSVQALLTRAQVRRRAGDLAAAQTDAEQGTTLDPRDSRLVALRGSLRVDTGRPAEGLADLELAITGGAGGPAHAAKARAWHKLGRFAEARDEWNLVLSDDPEDAAAFLGRARAFLHLGQWDQTLADLEDAIELGSGDPATLAGVTLTYAATLPARPSRLPRVVSLARRTAALWLRQGWTTPLR